MISRFIVVIVVYEAEDEIRQGRPVVFQFLRVGRIQFFESPAFFQLIPDELDVLFFILVISFMPAADHISIELKHGDI